MREHRRCDRFANSSSEAKKTRCRDAEGDAATGNEGIFLVTLDEDGQSTEFREWWNSRSLPA